MIFGSFAVSRVTVVGIIAHHQAQEALDSSRLGGKACEGVTATGSSSDSGGKAKHTQGTS